jgi:hypothetical protein
MSGMAKDTGEQSPEFSTPQALRLRRRQAAPSVANSSDAVDRANGGGHFVAAFADALRDILREERRRAA